MSKGIEVTWPDADGKIDEVEYFSGVDVDTLDALPSFSTVPTVWPQPTSDLWRPTSGPADTLSFGTSFSTATAIDAS